ncbi:hypothetical protein D0864_12217 [Hortaea werneckii]|uniref:Uncharacterized protein n=1 Tax=Hortaea werneckii TaxID=91943 RepID=A0A3M7DLP1_HORWE|nr:hypothetical protein KC352_g18459 [Hortaea werneckii]KAI7565291.1 hypothetical protein KC317_g6463 [Hortaea werneckii]KAI7616292.1 hypothetical protein KC346_g6064 [Hortaea werneckii]KAI7659530.1 hypothetical protein KC319_g8936 [Hortaea werneckii]KAI7705439.1 hypothetical protein KC322_g6270 [Hortaea werneckii]
MSQDLFAAFGSLEDEPRSGGKHDTKIGQDTPAPSQALGWPDNVAPNVNDDDDDDFGDFEDASAPVAATQEAPAITQQQKPGAAQHSKHTHTQARPNPAEKPKDAGKHPFAGNMDLLFAAGDDDEYDAGTDDLGDLSTNPEAAVAYSKQIFAAEQQKQPRSAPQAPQAPSTAKPPPTAEVVSQKLDPRAPNKLKKKNGYAPTRDPNVLFDAEDLSEHEEGDEFGDFAEVEPDSSHNNQNISTAQNKRHMPSESPAIDLLGLDDAPPRPLPEREKRPSSSAKTAPHKQPSKAPVPSTSHDEDDAWDDFEEMSTSAPSREMPVPKSAPSQPRPTHSKPSPKPDTGSQNSLPPTNIPPPTVLLSIFPSIFASADEALFTPLSRLEFKQKQMLLSHPATHQFLTGYLQTSIALARIVAGRKQRWKRDQILAQGMRIGPAAAGGSKGGMKLAGVDRSETAKEDREILDVLRLWKGQVGKLRSAVTAASSAPKARKLPPVPEIAEAMPIKALKPAEGGFTAPHACALCGLKREERVAKVDTAVEDSFGEWWVQGVNMHLVCHKFWVEHSGKLKSR